jgi:hypothetical protein
MHLIQNIMRVKFLHRADSRSQREQRNNTVTQTRFRHRHS